MLQSTRFQTHPANDPLPTTGRVANPRRTTLRDHMARTGHEPFVPPTGQMEKVFAVPGTRSAIKRGI